MVKRWIVDRDGRIRYLPVRRRLPWGRRVLRTIARGWRRLVVAMAVIGALIVWIRDARGDSLCCGRRGEWRLH